MTNNEPPRLPDNYFKKVYSSQYDELKKEHWLKVQDLDDNNPNKILYFRRFSEDFKSDVWFNPELTASSEPNFDCYCPNSTRINELPRVEPQKFSLVIPDKTELGITVGYHHLEKPWGMIFKDLFEKQIQSSKKIEFVMIENTYIPTGQKSPESESEIRTAIEKKGLTHIINLHEQCGITNFYMDLLPGISFNDSFYNSNIYLNTQEYTLDPFIPIWFMEEYFKGNTYPQLQYAINKQFEQVETLVKNI